jgi:hypothetical protein
MVAFCIQLVWLQYAILLDETLILPLSGVISPRMAFRSVDFPVPINPITIVREPFATRKFISLRARGESLEGRTFSPSKITAEVLGEFGVSSCNSIIVESLEPEAALWGPDLSSFHDSNSKKSWIRSKQLSAALMAGREDRSDWAGVVTNDIIAKEVNALEVESPSECCAEA